VVGGRAMTTNDERAGRDHAVPDEPDHHEHAPDPHGEHEDLGDEVKDAAAYAVTHERPGLASSGGMDSVISVAAFMIANRLGGLGWAIAASTAWSLRAAYVRRRKGIGVGKLLPVTAGVLVIRGVVGIVTDSEAIYFGSGIAIQAGIGLALVISVLIGRSFIGEFAPRILPFPGHVVAHPLFRSTMARLTLVAGAYELAKSGWDVWIYNNSSVNGFVLFRFLAGWLSGVIVITACIVLSDRRLRRIPGFEGMLPMLEAMNPGRAPAPGRAEP
jgi:hypothetical protein